MRYEDAISFLFSQLPMFQRIGAAAYRADLTNTLGLAELTGNPEREFKSVHIAGTNGKGSVSNLIASVFQEAGYKTGLYTSPHLKDFRERIRIDGVPVTREFVAEFVANYRSQWESRQIQPSFFEITVAMAFRYFADEKVDIAIVETGMGGRLDSTNIVIPELSIITNISLDHQQFLGDTIPLIAREKAGIIKNGVPVVLGKMVSEAREVCKNAAVSSASECFFETLPVAELPETDLPGDFQIENRDTALRAIRVLQKQFKSIDDSAILRGFANVRKNTGLRGRWDVLGQHPLIVADCGHNEAGIQAVFNEISKQRYAQLHVVFGMSADKDASKILSLLPKNAQYYFCKPDLPRGKNAEELQHEASSFGLKGDAYESVAKAFSASRLYASKEDMIFIGGSFFVVAEII
jgi:dihydrofolate synthase/folylpolyglutamate synthase